MQTFILDFVLWWLAFIAWWRHQMETFSALLAICAGNSPVPGEFPAKRPVTRSFDVFFDLRPDKRLSKQPWGWWFETPSWSLWRQCNGYYPGSVGISRMSLSQWSIPEEFLSWWRHQMKIFSGLLSLCEGKPPVNGGFPYKGKWGGALMFSLICAWTNGWANNRDACDLRRHRVHYDVTVKLLHYMSAQQSIL